MTSRRKSTREISQHSLRTISSVSVVLLATVFAAQAGNQTFSDFSTPSNSSQVFVGDTLSLMARDTLMVKIFGDTFPSLEDNFGAGPEITSPSTDLFNFFYVDSIWQVPGKRNVIRRAIGLDATNYTAQDTVRMYQHALSRLTYFHASQSPSGYLVTFLDQTFGNLQGVNGQGIGTIQSGSGPLSSQCHLDQDTFLVSHRINNGILRLKKIVSSGSSITILSDTIAAVASGSGTDVITNSSVAADSNGLILLLWTRGASADPARRLEFKLLDRAFVVKDSGLVTTGIGDPIGLVYYDDAPVISYRNNKFAAASWDVNGVVLHDMIWDGVNLSVQSTRIVNGAGYRSSTIACNQGQMVVAWKGDLNGDGRKGVEGLRYTIENGTLVTAQSDTFCFSDPDLIPSDPDFYNAAVNIALDPVGSIGVTWGEASRVKGCIWALRQVLHEQGFWISSPFQLASPGGDSIWVYGKTLDSLHSQYGSFQDSIRLGESANTSDGTWSAWHPMSDQASLGSAYRGTHSYCQYKIGITRNFEDSLVTPQLYGATLSWDTRPQNLTLDSIRVGTQMLAGVSHGDTIDCRSRIDELEVHCTGGDVDNGDVLTVVTHLLSGHTQTLPANSAISFSQVLPAIPTSDTLVPLNVTATDAVGWMSDTLRVWIRTRNAVPQLQVKAVLDTTGDGVVDTVDIGSTNTIGVDQGDSVAFVYSLIDSNDQAIWAYGTVNGTTEDSVMQGQTGIYWFHASPDNWFGYTTVTFSAEDTDSLVTRTAVLAVNHVPSISSLTFDGTEVRDGDSVSVVMGIPIDIVTHARDSDLTYWDTLSYRYITQSRSGTPQSDSVLTVSPQRDDSLVKIEVCDLCATCDTMQLWYRYPWFSSESAENPGYQSAKDTLGSELALIVGSSIIDTVIVPLVNSGNDSVAITSVQFGGSGIAWLKLLVPQNGGMVLFDSLSSSSSFAPVWIAPGQRDSLMVITSVAGLSGDGYVRDTIILGTSDPVHPFDSLPVQLEHNDLPALANISFEFTVDEPYWMAKSARVFRPYRAPEFPAHARVMVQFTEGIDTASVTSALHAYSVLDSTVTGTATHIPLRKTWNSDQTELTLSPAYTQPSPYFGITPPEGMFIPTDRIAFRFSSNITDRATTASGPNALDVNLDKVRDSGADTVVVLDVDSVTFDIRSVGPDSASDTSSIHSPIILTFNAPLLAGSIDTANVQNATLQVTSRFGGATPVTFDSVRVSGNQALFYPSKPFFYGDSVRCRYRSKTARNLIGYPADISRDGIPQALWDSSSTADDYQWWFLTKTISASGVSPVPGDTGVDGRSPVTLTFAGPIAGLIDTARVNNSTLEVRSAYMPGTRIPFDTVAIEGNVARFYPAMPFYYGDSILCSYRGLATEDSGFYSIELPHSGVVSTDDSLDWSFRVAPIRLESVDPESASVRGDIHAVVTMQFSGKIYPGSIDTDSLFVNRSLSMISKYGTGAPSPFRRIELSADSTAVIFYPESTFFSMDSITCSFAGFARRFPYDTAFDFFGSTGSRIESFSWYFKTGNAGFYVYPNPYKPGSDSRHCGAPGAPCGVVFKNLHTLQDRRTDQLRVRVLTMNGHPVYDSRKTGEEISISAQGFNKDPQWKWDTRNTRGNLVASGLYFFLVLDAHGKTLGKGKLLIVR